MFSAVVMLFWIVCSHEENIFSGLHAVGQRALLRKKPEARTRMDEPSPGVEAHLLDLSHDPKPLDNMIENGVVCEDYGCPLYPSEFNDLQEEIKTIRNTDIHKIPPNEFNMAMMTHKGHIKTPPINQDAVVLLHPFRTKQTSSKKDFLMGIFDGHGRLGHDVAWYAAKAIPEILARKFNDFAGGDAGGRGNTTMDDSDIQEALKATFVEADIDAPPISAMEGGTTASVTLRRGGKLYIANTGDSRTIVVSVLSEDQVEIPFMTRFDKAHLPDEMSRIVRMGGRVKYPGNKTALSRVYEYSSAARETIGLAMSRSIGDWEFGAVGVIAEPLVSVIVVDSLTNAFVLAASDGMWDTRKPIFFANKFANSLSRQHLHPLLACYEAIEQASPQNEKFYRDDMSMIAMKLLP
jgi:serine/threonine protein phosphatase PrpC